MHLNKFATILENIKYSIETIDNNSFDPNFVITYLLRSLETGFSTSIDSPLPAVLSEKYAWRLDGKELGVSGFGHLLQ